MAEPTATGNRLSGCQINNGREAGRNWRAEPYFDMGLLTSIIKKLPGGSRLTEAVSYRRRKRQLERVGDAEARFTRIFTSNQWKDAESRSGAGSSLAATAAVRQALPQLFDEYAVRSLLDAPCGDFNWIRKVPELSNVQYVGGDIVQPLIDENRAQYSSDTVRFEHLDITTSPLPDVDLWMCRDCLIHLSFSAIERALANFRRSSIKYWLLTTHRRVERNIDIPTGHCRMLNLELPPFSFPPPVRYVPDDDAEATGKCLGLWERSQLQGIAMSHR